MKGREVFYFSSLSSFLLYDVSELAFLVDSSQLGSRQLHFLLLPFPLFSGEKGREEKAIELYSFSARKDGRKDGVKRETIWRWKKRRRKRKSRGPGAYLTSSSTTFLKKGTERKKERKNWLHTDSFQS